MKKRIFCLAILFTLTSITSCTKFLQTTPESFIAPETYYTTADQLQTALNGVYSILGYPDGSLYNNNLVYALVTPSDELYYFSAPRTAIQNFLYDASDNNISLLWRGLYSGIERANLLLANINKPSMDENQRNLIKGQALFLRAYYYFLLVSYYGDVPLLLTPTSSLDEVNVPRTPSKTVYDQVLADMTTAEGLLQTQTITSLGYGGKVTKTAVEGILARVCLKMAGYPLRDVSKYADAKAWCLKVINSGEHALNPDYKQVFINYAQDKYDIKESMWEVEFYGNAIGPYNVTGFLGNFIGLTNIGDLNIGYSGCMLRTVQKFYKLYETDPVTGIGLDLRRDWNCSPYAYSGTPGVKAYQTTSWQYYPGKWRREYETFLPKAKNQTPENAVILRYSDVLLMLAEAESELNGPDALAYNAINQVRERAWGTGSRVTTIAVTNGGTGYTAAPTVTISAGGISTIAINNTATATANISGGKVTSITIVSPGANYTAPPTVTITGGNGTGATATATITAFNQTDADLPAGLLPNAFRQRLQDERSRELCFESQRNQDLIRWGIFLSTMTGVADNARVTGANAIVAADYSQATSRNVLLPIPSHEISLNKALTQNPGY